MNIEYLPQLREGELEKKGETFDQIHAANRHRVEILKDEVPHLADYQDQNME